MIRAYPAHPTVSRGADLVLHVATTAPRFRVVFGRQGERFETIARDERFHDGVSVPPGVHDRAWQWPAYRFAVGRRWPPGAYVATLLEDGDDGGVPLDTPDARSAKALFVVRAEPRAPLLVVLPLFTYHAYNVAHVDGTLGAGEGECLYSGYSRVTWLRPGGGTGGHPWDEVNADAYDATSPRQTFAHWDAKALAWLSTTGYRFDVCTDLELHDDGFPLDDYRLIASFGHHEYWSASMRARVERFVVGGGNVAFFGGNTCWFRVRVGEGWFERDGQFSDPPENALTGCSYRSGGGKWIGTRPPTGYTVECASHWAYAGSGLRDGDVFGADERLVGYECDGMPRNRGDATPASFVALGTADLGNWNVRDGSGEVSENGRAAFGVWSGGGSVFSASTTDWARALQAGNTHVGTITQNVIERFTG